MKDRDTSLPHLLVHSPHICSRWLCASLKPGDKNLICISLWVSWVHRATWTIIPCSPGCAAGGSWNGKMGWVLSSGTLQWDLNLHCSVRRQPLGLGLTTPQVHRWSLASLLMKFQNTGRSFVLYHEYSSIARKVFWNVPPQSFWQQGNKQMGTNSFPDTVPRRRNPNFPKLFLRLHLLAGLSGCLPRKATEGKYYEKKVYIHQGKLLWPTGRPHQGCSLLLSRMRGDCQVQPTDLLIRYMDSVCFGTLYQQRNVSGWLVRKGYVMCVYWRPDEGIIQVFSLCKDSQKPRLSK